MKYDYRMVSRHRLTELEALLKKTPAEGGPPGNAQNSVTA